MSDAETIEHLRMAEALLFAASEPLDEESLAARLPDDADVPALLAELQARYEKAGVNLVRVGGKWQFRTAPDLSFLLQKEVVETRRLSRAATETLAIIAYHQPVTRAEIEEVRGVALSKGTLDLLMEERWVRPKGKRRTPGRPVTYGTTDEFLSHFGLESIQDLPGFDELKAAGLLDSEVPADFFGEGEPPMPGEDGADTPEDGQQEIPWQVEDGDVSEMIRSDDPDESA